MLSLLPQVLKCFFPSILAWLGNPWEGRPLASQLKLRLIKKILTNDKQMLNYIRSQLHHYYPQPRNSHGLFKTRPNFVGRNLVVRVITIVIIETPWQNRKNQQNEPNGLRFDRFTQHLLRHTSPSMPPGKQNACYGRCFSNSFVLWFLHLWVHLCIWQVRFWCYKNHSTTHGFWAFVGETHKAGGITIGSFQKVW